ncbi:TPA: glycosyltransferase, partial [Campylobacter jejuni]|nr:glycosyltransferase [Campylobacter jejuni]
MPQLSIIIPLFNSCDFISRALQSCINQTLKDIEILIID